MESQDNDLFQSIIESFPRSVLALDITGHITYANPATTELTGYSREDILGKHFTKLGFLRLQDIPKLITFSSELLRGESLKQIEIAYKTRGRDPLGNRIHHSTKNRWKNQRDSSNIR
jgi:PAS domain S-box-containing protein